MVSKRNDAHTTQPRRLNIRDVAARIGLSYGTVSRVLNGKPDVAAATRARVQAALKELGYVPSRAATSLSTGRSGLLGLMIGEIHDPTALAAMEGALTAAVPAGYGVIVYMTTHEREHETIYTEMISRGGVDGALLLWPRKVDEPFVQRIERSGLPLVLIEPQAEVPGVPSVHANAYDDGYLCTQHLLQLGHRRVGACIDASGWGMEDRYLVGYAAALDEAGISVDPTLSLMVGPTYEAGYETAMSWLDLLNPPTAMCFCSDMAALGALAAARERRLLVPDDLSIVGYDDTQMAHWVKPALTTLHERRYSVARAACTLLISRIQGEEPPDEPVLVTTGLAIRQSTDRARLPGGNRATIP